MAPCIPKALKSERDTACEGYSQNRIHDNKEIKTLKQVKRKVDILEFKPKGMHILYVFM